MLKKTLVTIATGLSLVLGAGVALATPHIVTQGDRLFATPITASTDCKLCHENTEAHTTGPHGGYTASTNKCNTCHDVHITSGSEKGVANGKADYYNEQLLPGQSLTAACNYCHDLTGSKDGPYNMTNGMTVGAAHRVVDLNGTWSYKDSEGHDNNNSTTQTQAIWAIPGGYAQDGTAGEIKLYENKPGNDYSDGSQGRLSGSVFTCDSCHTPHGINTVAPYLGESQVKVAVDLPAGTQKMYLTTRLLKNYPNGNTMYQSLTPGDKIKATEYGSQWCLGCHNGRDALGTMDHNHPVNETLKGYTILEDSGLTVQNGVYGLKWVETTIANDPRKNTQYALTAEDESVTPHATRPDGYKEYSLFKKVDPDTLETTNLNGPSCQQCHGSARDVEQAFAAGTNPARLSFPHISQNKALLVETNDDFCTNCHAPSMLP